MLAMPWLLIFLPGVLGLPAYALLLRLRRNPHPSVRARVLLSVSILASVAGTVLVVVGFYQHYGLPHTVSTPLPPGWSH
jgi:hypothetical protein